VVLPNAQHSQKWWRMTLEQAREVLRATAQHAITMAPYIYGLKNEVSAVALIKEALAIDIALQKKDQTNG
jgi:hypothetical protein